MQCNSWIRGEDKVLVNFSYWGGHLNLHLVYEQYEYYLKRKR